MVWRLIWRALQFAVALAVVGALAVGYLFWRAMPAYSGSEKLPGLAAEVRVWRDAYGVPHIFAASMDDAVRALGYLHASERLFQMEMLRRVGQGRLAEVLGPDRLNIDKFVRTLGFYREAEKSFDALSPWAQKRFEAYAEGYRAQAQREAGSAALTSEEARALADDLVALGDSAADATGDTSAAAAASPAASPGHLT